MAQSLKKRRDDIRQKVKDMFIGDGGHDGSEGQCVMEAVALVTNNMKQAKKTDHPETACSSITEMMIAINDKIDDDDRQLLKKLVPYIAWTNDGKAQARQKRILKTFMCIAASKAKRKDEKAMYIELARCIKNDNLQKAIDLIAYPEISDPSYLGKYNFCITNSDLLSAFENYRTNDCDDAASNLGDWWLEEIGSNSESVKLFVQMMVRILDKPLYPSKALNKRLERNYKTSRAF